MNFLLLATLTVTLGLAVTSCKDDDDNGNANKNSEEAQEGQNDQATEFWAVVGQLVGTSDVTDDYQSQTYTAIIGEAFSDNATIRRVMTNDMESAAERFASLVGLDEGVVDENTASYTWSSEAVGTLTYTKTQDGSSLATVDVDIKQVPGLRQIVYLTPGQAGKNAGNYTTCYYRFGDVISRVRPEDQVTEYWICVRPSFEPEGKGTSHWVTVSPLPDKNLAKYGKASNNKLYTMPDNIGKNDEQAQNFAEMLYAIAQPEQWEQNVINNPDGTFSSGIKMFHDFKKSDVKYHSQLFWERVSAGWSQKTGDYADLWKLLFGSSRDEFNAALVSNGLHLLYNGYTWHWTFSNNLTLYEMAFTNGTGKKSNMHTSKKKEITHQVINKSNHDNDIVVNVSVQYTQAHPYLDNNTLKSSNNQEKFFGDNNNSRYYIIRHATGDELSKIGGGRYDTKTPISGFENVYVYNNLYNKDLNTAPEVRDDIEKAKEKEEILKGVDPQEGYLVDSNGKFYKNKADCEKAGVEPIAIVVYMSTDGTRVEKGKPWTGLAMELKDYNDGTTNKFKWVDTDKEDEASNICSTITTFFKQEDYCSGILDGWAMTQHLATQKCGCGHHHPAAEKAWSTDRPEGFSEWFLPSAGQWILALRSLGHRCELKTSVKNGNTKYYWDFKLNALPSLWSKAGVSAAAIQSGHADWYHSTTQYLQTFKIISFSNGNITPSLKTTTEKIRRVMAFGNGGTIDPEPLPQPIQPRPGAVFSGFGNCYASLDDLRKLEDETNVLGMVVYYSPKKRVEKGKNYNGLGIALSDAVGTDKQAEISFTSDETEKEKVSGSAVDGTGAYATTLDGSATTDKLRKVKNPSHPAASASYKTVSSNVYNVSNYFLPSAGQWILARQGMGFAWSADGLGHFNTDGKWVWGDAGLSAYALDGKAEYWTSTEQKDGQNYKALAIKPTGVTFLLRDKTEKARVRAFFAFGRHGTED